MSPEAIMHRVGTMEGRRLKRWIRYVVVLWIVLWGMQWGLRMHFESETTPLEEQDEVIEAFVELYPIGP